MTTQSAPIVGYRLRDGRVVHQDCETEVSQNAHKAVSYDVLLSSWPHGAVCAYCNGRTAKPNVNHPRFSGTWVDTAHRSRRKGTRTMKNGDHEWYGPTTAKKIRANKVIVGDVLIPWQNNNTIHDTVIEVKPHGKTMIEFTVSRQYVGETFAYTLGVIHGRTADVKIFSKAPRAKRTARKNCGRTSMRNGTRLTSGPIVHGTKALGERLSRSGLAFNKSLEKVSRGFEAGEAVSRRVAVSALAELKAEIESNATLYYDRRDVKFNAATIKMLERAIAGRPARKRSK